MLGRAAAFVRYYNNESAICTQSRFIVSPVKNNDNFRLNGICSSSVSSSLLLSTSSPNIMVRVYGGDGLSGSSGSKNPGFKIMFGIRSNVSHSSASENNKQCVLFFFNYLRRMAFLAKSRICTNLSIFFINTHRCNMFAYIEKQAFEISIRKLCNFIAS